MKNLQRIYWILALIFLLITIVLTLYTYQEGGDWASLFLSGTAIIIALLAIGISDKKLPIFKGIVKCWSDNPHLKKNRLEGSRGSEMEEQEEEDENENDNIEYKISFRIENTSNMPVHDVKVKIRCPHRITNVYQEKNQGLIIRKHGYTYVFCDDSYGILGTTENKDYIHYDLKVMLNQWNHNQGHFYITINGTNIQTVTFLLKWEDIPNLKVATKQEPIFLKSIHHITKHKSQ